MRKTGSILVALLLLFGLTACCGPGNEPESESVPKGDGQITSEPAPSSREPAVSITETAARTVDLELYETPDFSIQIPKGWTVTSGGTGMYHSIRIQDPAEPLNQMFVLLKADILLHSQEGKDAWAYYSGISGVPGADICLRQSCQPPLLRTFLKFFRSMQILLCRLSRVILAIPSPGLKDLLSPSVSRQPAV